MIREITDDVRANSGRRHFSSGEKLTLSTSAKRKEERNGGKNEKYNRFRKMKFHT